MSNSNPPFNRKAYMKKYMAELYVRTRRGSFENRLKDLLANAKARSKRSGIEFSICFENFSQQENCPLLGVAFKHDNTPEDRSSSMSIDRIDPALGYTPENTWLISQRANRIKNNATIEEFEMIAKNWRAELERRKSHARES